MAESLAEAWQMYVETKDARNRWEGHLAKAEERFAALAEAQGLTWAEAVEAVAEAEAA